MGTNFPEFLQEANRVLKPNGILFIAEVLSRFGEITDFIKHMKDESGFDAIKVSTLKGFFYIMIFKKIKDVRTKGNWSKEFSEQLKPCLYKRR